jgi:amino acid transporter
MPISSTTQSSTPMAGRQFRDSDPHFPAAGLQRVLTLWPLTFYGLGVVLGAGIYVAIGAIIGRAGNSAPLSFLIAGAAAALTGLCYAELASRFPDAAGAAAYVQRAFHSVHLGRATGAAVTLAVAISGASVAEGAVRYLAILLPLPSAFAKMLLVGGFTLIAVAGVRSSVGLAALIGALEIAGLVAATIVGFRTAPDFSITAALPVDAAAWAGVFAGAFIAFFAFVGFETLVNLAEEVKDARRTMPRGIIIVIAISIVLYVAVASAAVASEMRSELPLLGLFEGSSAPVFAAVAFLSVANGVLVDIIMLSRLFYGMARNRQLPSAFARIQPRAGTPAFASLFAGAIVLTASLLVTFERLLVLANALTLAIFVLVDIGLWRIKRGGRAPPEIYQVWPWIPPIAAVLSIGLIAAELLR